MKPGEIETKTPNAVNAIRGTVVVAEVVPTPEGHRSTISVLRRLIDVTRLDTGHRVGLSVNVGAPQSIAVMVSNPLTRPNAISADKAKRLTSEFRIIPNNVPRAATAPAVQYAMQQATPDEAVTLL